eukprot:COSAG02_NODE_2761_length_8075_cov_130.144308_5_plen_143_part_00
MIPLINGTFRSTGGAQTMLISGLVRKTTQWLGAVRGVCCTYQCVLRTPQESSPACDFKISEARYLVLSLVTTCCRRCCWRTVGCWLRLLGSQAAVLGRCSHAPQHVPVAELAAAESASLPRVDEQGVDEEDVRDVGALRTRG